MQQLNEGDRRAVDDDVAVDWCGLVTDLTERRLSEDDPRSAHGEADAPHRFVR